MVSQVVQSTPTLALGEERTEELEGIILRLEEDRAHHASLSSQSEQRVGDLQIQCSTLEARLGQRDAQMTELQAELRQRMNDTSALEREVGDKYRPSTKEVEECGDETYIDYRLRGPDVS